MRPLYMFQIHGVHHTGWDSGRGRRVNPIHSHPMWEFVAYPDGKGQILGDCRDAGFGPGSICLFPPGLTHGESSTGPGASTWLLFEGPVSLPAVFHQVADEPHRPMFALLDLMHHEFRRHDGGKALFPMLQTLLVLFARGLPQTRMDPRVALIWQLIRANLSNGAFRITQAFRKAGLAPSACHRLFAEATGETPMAALTRLRMEEAQAMLLHHDVPVKEVAFAVGYPDPFHFSRVFRQVVGLSPMSFRRTMHGKNP